jgi:hypothetical protein
MNILSFDRLKNNIDIIKTLSVNEFTIYNSNYSLKALVCCPFAGHYKWVYNKFIRRLLFVEKKF